MDIKGVTVNGKDYESYTNYWVELDYEELLPISEVNIYYEGAR